MTTSYTIYHNPKCSKSRATLALLEEHNITPTIVEYLRNPPDAQTIDTLLKLLALEPRELMRSKEAEYAEADLDNAKHNRGSLIAAIIAHPKLLERPIVVKHDSDKGDSACIGRPPENVLALL
jgi:arsenate reductase (glutaredoxin)